MKQIETARNTIVPALFVLESRGLTAALERAATGDIFRAARGDEIYVGEDPVAVHGLVKLVEAPGWDWHEPTPLWMTRSGGISSDELLLDALLPNGHALRSRSR